MAAATESPELLSELRHDLKTPLNQIIGYGEMLLEDAESDGNKETASRLRTIVETARACVESQTRALVRPADEVNGVVWRELGADQSARAKVMTEILTNLRGESTGQAAGDLDRLLQAVRDLERLAREAPSKWAGTSPLPGNVADTSKPVFSLHVEPETGSPESAAGPCLGRLLVVDDNEVNRDMLSRRLIRERYEVTQAANGREALEILERENFDLVLLDIIMPELDGFAVLERLRANPRWKDTPVIMISALDEISHVVRCIEMGAEDYLPKPFDPVLLRARLGAILERKRMREADQRMLRNILPAKVAAELRERGSVEPMYFEDVTIGFTDFVGFTLATERLAAEELVGYLHDYFTAFDHIMARYGLEKMKTIGDSYMFVSGMPDRQPSHPVDAVLASLEIVETVKRMAKPNDAVDWKVRVGLHTGPVIAGVVGIHKFAFDIWGDSVNFASRMESSGEANRVNVSDRTWSRIKDFMRCTPRGQVRTKDGREVDMFFVDGPHEKLMTGGTTHPEAFARRYKIYFQKDMKAFPPFLMDGR
jgi:CheY-like chemotaxis protein